MCGEEGRPKIKKAWEILGLNKQITVAIVRALNRLLCAVTSGMGG